MQLGTYTNILTLLHFKYYFFNNVLLRIQKSKIEIWIVKQKFM
jgi:hypothetical protein